MRGRFNIKVENTPESLEVLDKIYSVKKSARGKIFLSALERYFNTPEGAEILRVFKKPQSNPSNRSKASEAKKVSLESVMGDF